MGLENKNVWDNLKGTSALVMLLLYRTPSPPLLRAVSLHIEEFSWPETFFPLPDSWLIMKRFGYLLIQNPTEERAYPCSVFKVIENQSKCQKPNKIACRQIPLLISLKSKLNIYAFIHSVNNLLCSSRALV